MRRIVVITVDVETPQTPLIEGRLHECLMDKEIGGERWGISKILTALDEFGFKGTFFINILEINRFGERSVREVVDLIESRGHEAALHTHPVWWDSKGRERLWEFSEQEQLEILESEIVLFEKFVGKPPLSHRAGLYGINETSIKVLESLGIRTDSSAFWRHPDCRFTPSVNKPVKFVKLFEIPVTVFAKKFLFGGTKIYTKLLKLDIDWATLDEMLFILEKTSIPIFVIFLHSYSLMKFSSNWRTITPNYKKLEKFLELLNFLDANRDKFSVLPFRDMLKYNHLLFSKNFDDCLPYFEVEILEKVLRRKR